MKSNDGGTDTDRYAWLPADVVGSKRFDRWGKEVIVKYKTDIGSHGLFYTDANGREMVQREYNVRGPSYPTLKVSEPVAGNYYPINSMIAIQDDKNQLAVVTDVSQGGSSLKDGEIKLWYIEESRWTIVGVFKSH